MHHSSVLAGKSEGDSVTIERNYPRYFKALGECQNIPFVLSTPLSVFLRQAASMSSYVSMAQLSSPHINSARLNPSPKQLHSSQVKSGQLNSAQLNSTQLISTRLKSTQLNSIQSNSRQNNSTQITPTQTNAAQLSPLFAREIHLNPTQSRIVPHQTQMGMATEPAERT